MSDNKDQKLTLQSALLAAQSISNIASVVNQPKNGNKPVFALSTGVGEILEKAGYERSESAAGPLMYVLEDARGSAQKTAPALAFTENPAPSDNFLGLYKTKRRALPDEVLKQVRITDHLVAAILRSRGSMLSLYGHLRPDRFGIGIEVEILPEFYKLLNPEQFKKVKERIKRFEQILLNCGHTDGLENQDKMTLAEYFDIQARNGLTFGRFATEMIYDRQGERDEAGNFPFHRFRPVDVATIVRAVRKGETVGSSLRVTAIRALESITGEKIDIDFKKLEEDRYAWLQVIDGTPRQGFTHDEMLVYNLFPSTDVEHNGYPISPIDTVVSSVTTHISIDAYKKLYFQNGRASKGMLVIQSDEVDQQTLDNMKLQFNASINNVSNSFRTPIFGIGKDDKVDWLSMQGEGLGDEFQFMYDQIARNILAAFGMSPDELPGYGHLSKGTNSQTLSESNNEFKLTAARDTGLRPMILKFQTFINQRLFPIIDPLLCKICEVKLSGLDAQSKEQESTRLQQDQALHMTYDETLHEVDKDPIGKVLGGEFPFNERWQLVADKYKNVGDLLGPLMGSVSANVDPLLRYKRDPFYLQWLQLVAQANPGAVQALFAPRPYTMEILRMNIQDEIDSEENT
jgi:hypothetical protein